MDVYSLQPPGVGYRWTSSRKSLIEANRAVPVAPHAATAIKSDDDPNSRNGEIDCLQTSGRSGLTRSAMTGWSTTRTFVVQNFRGCG